MAKMTAEQSAALNAAIEALDGRDDLPGVVGMQGTGKPIPYIGWFWRTVDFTQPVTLGRIREERSVLEQMYGMGVGRKLEPGWAGFMENNKWDYPEWVTTPEQTDEIIDRLQDAVADPTQTNLQAVYDYLQKCMPDDVLNWDGRTGYDEWLAEEAGRQR